MLDDPDRWREQYGNFRHAYLFSLRRGKRGIRKYYSGWRVFCLLAGSNIRYLLELVDRCFAMHMDRGGSLLGDAIDAEIQTLAAHEVGHRNLRELEGLSLSGAKVTRLLLGLGRSFQVLAENPVGHTPEVNQFCLKANVEDADCRSFVEELLREGVAHLGLVRYPGSKLQRESELRDFDYVIHPIFAPFFGFSHRRKRKIYLSDRDILDLVDKPTVAIRRVLKSQNRIERQKDLPEQMSLFSDYYDVSNR